MHWKVYEAVRFIILSSYSDFGATKINTQKTNRIFIGSVWFCMVWTPIWDVAGSGVENLGISRFFGYVINFTELQLHEYCSDFVWRMAREPPTRRSTAAPSSCWQMRGLRSWPVSEKLPCAEGARGAGERRMAARERRGAHPLCLPTGVQNRGP